MQSDAPAAPPRVILPLVERLRTDLLTADYTVEAVDALLGEVAAAALRRENPVPARRVLARDGSPLATLLGVLTLGEVAPRSRVEAALPTLGADGAIALGLLAPADGTDAAAGVADGADADADADAAADAADEAGAPALGPDAPLRSTVDLSPYSAQDDLGEIRWWIASDPSELATGRALHPEHVLGVGGASLTLARITPRDRVGSVLDLGCGGGVQALHAARHADRVVATDLSERALAFAAFNAALNEVEIELRQGSLLEPVVGEAFDLIVSNPPFVITPRTRPAAGEDDVMTYRDGGRAGDSLLAELLAAIPAHLAPGGRSVMLGNWEIADVEDPLAHPRAWLADAVADGVDAWVIQRESEDPARYAETWARDGGVTDRDARWADLQEAWLDDFASRRVAEIGFGYLLLRRRPTTGPERPGVLRTEIAAGTGSGTLSTHLTAALAMIGTLGALDDEALLASRPVRAEDVVERRHLTPGEWDPMLIEIVQGAGFARSMPADQMLAATVGALDGTLTLDQTISAICALTGDDVDEARTRTLPRLREALVGGMLAL
ncbi:DUF7059 domain-containing protein [Brachybacterium sp. DNPG3]